MCAIKRLENSEPQFTPEDPEGGCFWHALSAETVAMFEESDEEFGQVTSETTNTKLEGVRCIRCRPDREGVLPWLRDGAKLLAIQKDDLSAEDWLVAGRAGDIHVRAAAALANGQFVDGDEPVKSE